MKPTKRVWIWIIAIVAILLIYSGITYNRLVKSDENVKLNWGNLQNAYQRRMDLTPSLVAIVKGASDFEKQTLTQVANARAEALQTAVDATGLSAENYSRFEKTQGDLANSVNRIIGIIENYPDLKSSKNYLYLQSQLEGTERRIKVSRSDFNQSVADYNKMVRGFPSGSVARMFGFRAKEGFTSDAGANQAPEVKF
jgi:LemA protein